MDNQEQLEPDRPQEPALIIPIEGMTCAVCVKRVESAIRAVPGVSDVEVSLSAGRAIIRSDRIESSTRRIGEAVYRAGYIPGLVKIELAIIGMNCPSCRLTVEKAIQAVRGVVSARISLSTGRARVEASVSVPAATIIRAVEHSGYSATLVPPAEISSQGKLLSASAIRALLFGRSRRAVETQAA